MRNLSLPAVSYRKKCQVLAILCVTLIVILFFHGWRLGLVDSVTNRLRFHAIPVAVSVVYHGHPHDYTAIREVALPFQGEGTTAQLLAQSVKQDISQRAPYFWVADDRGFADFAILAFRIFGPYLSSMYFFWFLCLSFSVALFLRCYKNETWALGLMVLTLLGIYNAVSVLPLADEANFLLTIGGGARGFSTVSIYESRFLDVLAMVPVMHFVLFSLKTSWRFTRLDIAGVVGQMVFFFWLYHSRSSLGWQIVAVAACSVSIIGGRIWSNRKCNLFNFRSILAPCTLLALLACGVSALAVYKTATYHPRYFQDMGVRTFWHNALMGVSSDPSLAATYRLSVSDFDAARAVINYAATGGCSKTVGALTPQELLNSLGGHGEQDWKAYEVCARNFYTSLWKAHLLRMAYTYLVIKPRETLRIIVRSARDSGVSAVDAHRDRLNIGWSPFGSLPAVFMLLVLYLRQSRCTGDEGSCWRFSE